MPKRPYRHYTDDELFKLALRLEDENLQPVFYMEQLALVEAEISEREWASD
jgi:hypothetical protein